MRYTSSTNLSIFTAISLPEGRNFCNNSLQMSTVKKLTIKRGLRSPFSRKSSKKDTDDREKDYDDDVATTDPKKGGSNGRSLREPGSRSRKWPFKGKSMKHREENNGKTTSNSKNDIILTDSTNAPHGNRQPGSTDEKLAQQQNTAVQAKCDKEAGYATADQNGFPDKSIDHEQYVTPVRRSIDADSCVEDTVHGFLKTNIVNGTNNNQNEAGMSAATFNSENSISETLETNLPCSGDSGAPMLPPKPPSLRGRSLKQQDMELPPRPPARQRNRIMGMGHDPNPLHLRGIIVSDSTGQYETVKIDSPSAIKPGGGVAAELAKLHHQAWYWGPLTQEEAEEKLKTRPDGYFLVRDSSDERYFLSLSFNSHGRTLHTRIEYRNGLFSLNDSEGHTSVVELIDQAVKESRGGVYGYMRDSLGLQSYPAQLKNWVSRFTEVRSLQHLCRFVIREVYPRHHITELPLPRKIKEYILQNQYF